MDRKRFRKLVSAETTVYTREKRYVRRDGSGGKVDGSIEKLDVKRGRETLHGKQRNRVRVAGPESDKFTTGHTENDQR